MNLLMVACGGALGASLRYGLARALAGYAAYPWATQLANVGGSFCIGLAIVLVTGRWGAGHPAHAFVIVGLLGGFTTFSSFSLETVRLVEQGRAGVAAVYVIGSVVLCVLAAFGGIAAARRMVL